MEKHLPDDVVEEILTRLPLIAVLRFKSVCKTWRKMIDNPSFGSKHLTRTTEGKSDLTFIFLCKSKRFHGDQAHLVECKDSHINSTQMNFCRWPKDLVSTKHYANGLVCFSSKRYCRTDHEYIKFTQIVNPVTGEPVNLPEIRASDDFKVVSGFGFVSSTAEYKVVHLFYLKAEAQIFTLGSNSWRKLEGVGLPDPPYLIDSSSASVNGSLHWLTKSGYVLTFDLTSEKFGKIVYPAHLSPVRLCICQVLNLDGCLSITNYSYFPGIKLWILKDYNVNESWVEVVIPRNGGELWPISFWRKRELLLLKGRSTLVSFNLDTGRFTRPPAIMQGLIKDVFPYTGNILSPKTASQQ